MKHSTTKMTIAAAALMVAAGAASAQTMKANVPFAFRTGNSVMQAGTYRVSMNSSERVVLIQNEASQKATYLLASARLGDGWKGAGDAKLVFSCRVDDCTLIQAWSGNPSVAFALPHSKDRDSDATLFTIHLRR